MTKSIKILIIACGAGVCALAGFLLGTRYSEANQARPLISVFEESANGATYTFYTYYVGPKSEKVLHGKHYTINGANKVVTDYQDGRCTGFTAATVHP